MGFLKVSTRALGWWCIMVLSCCTYAQQPGNPFFAGLSLGPSFPVGKYYLNDPDQGSYANPGVALSAQAGWNVNDHWGITVHFGEYLHPIDQEGVVYDKMAADPFIENLLLKSGPFEVRTYTLGLYYRTALYKTLYISGKAMGGMLWARTPDQLYGASYFGGINYSYTITSAKDLAPSLFTGISLEYEVCYRVRMALESEFVYGNADFTFYTSTSSYESIHHITFINTVLSVMFLF